MPNQKKIYTKFVERIQNKWDKEIGKRWSMCTSPSGYAQKEKILDYQKEILKRSTLPFWDYTPLSQQIPAEWVHACAVDMHEALYYGALAALLDYASIPYFTMPPKRLGVQHGYVFEICNWEKSKIGLQNLVWSKKKLFSIIPVTPLHHDKKILLMNSGVSQI